MRTLLLLLAALATSAAITSTAEAQWMRARRSSECANGQCGASAAGQVASQAPIAAENAEAAPTPEVQQPAAAAASDTTTPATPAVVPAATTPSSSAVSSARARTVSNARDGRLWRRIRSRS